MYLCLLEILKDLNIFINNERYDYRGYKKD